MNTVMKFGGFVKDGQFVDRKGEYQLLNTYYGVWRDLDTTHLSRYGNNEMRNFTEVSTQRLLSYGKVQFFDQSRGMV
jgi:hypothetical protein